MRRASFILSILLAAATACGDSTAPEPSVVGSYALSTINGSALPYSVTEGTGSVLYESGTATLAENGTFTMSITATFDFPDFGFSGRETLSANGTYTRSGSTLTTKSSEGETSVMTIDGNKLRQTEDGMTAVWVRK